MLVGLLAIVVLVPPAAKRLSQARSSGQWGLCGLLGER